MPAERAFLDSNLICYLFGSDPTKADRTEQLLTTRPVISVQVLAEVCNVGNRKAKLSWPEIEEIVAVVSALCDVIPLTADIQHQACAFAARTGYTIYDAQIIAAALSANCTCLWSEDMQDGHKLTSSGSALLIRNPFTNLFTGEAGLDP
jgi:predicted nucleic acid-binding protein